jgi:hypothetical protein
MPTRFRRAGLSDGIPNQPGNSYRAYRVKITGTWGKLPILTNFDQSIAQRKGPEPQ